MEAELLSFDVLENSIDDLKRLQHFLLETNNSIWAWKWVAISMNSALYGFASFACSGTSFLNLIDISRKIKTYKVSNHQELRKLIVEDKVIGLSDLHLISPHQILKRCESKDLMDGQKPLLLTKQQKASIEYLRNELRNTFSHPKPGIQAGFIVAGYPKLSKDVLTVIRFLITDGIVRWREEEQRQIAIECCNVCLEIVKAIVKKKKAMNQYQSAFE